MNSLVRFFLRGLAMGLGFGLARWLLRHPIFLILVLSGLYFTLREHDSQIEFKNSFIQAKRIGQTAWSRTSNFFGEIMAAN